MKLVGTIISQDGVLQGTWEAEGTPEEMADFIARRQMQLTVRVNPAVALPTTTWSNLPDAVVKQGVDPAVPSGPSEDP